MDHPYDGGGEEPPYSREELSYTGHTSSAPQAMWRTIHWAASIFPDDAPDAKKRLAIAWLWSFVALLNWCNDTCSPHWAAYLEDHSPDLSSRDAFFRWTVDAHNTVNQRLGKPVLTYEQAEALYQRDVVRQCVVDPTPSRASQGGAPPPPMTGSRAVGQALQRVRSECWSCRRSGGGIDTARQSLLVAVAVGLMLAAIAAGAAFLWQRKEKQRQPLSASTKVPPAAVPWTPPSSDPLSGLLPTPLASPRAPPADPFVRPGDFLLTSRSA
jgi:hypothetical protein